MKGIGLVVALLFLSCKGQKKVIENTHQSSDGRLVLLVQDAFFPTDSLETHVIKDAKTLNAFFRTVNKTRKPGLPVPLVDFGDEMVLVACMGEMEGDVEPKLEILEENQKQLDIGIEIDKKPSAASLNTYPFCVYRMPKTEKSIYFKYD